MPRLSRRLFLALAAFLPLPRLAGAEDGPQRWVCTYNECAPYVYDPAHGDPDNIAGDHPIPPGVAFEDLPEDWHCPVCGAPKQWFETTDKPWKPIA